MTTTDIPTHRFDGPNEVRMIDGREMIVEVVTILASKAKEGDNWKGRGIVHRVATGPKWVTLYGQPAEGASTDLRLGKVEVGEDIIVVRMAPSPAQRYLDDWKRLRSNLANRLLMADENYEVARVGWLADLERKGVISHMEWSGMDLVMAKATHAQWEHIRNVAEKRPTLDIVAATVWLAHRTVDRLIDGCRGLSGSSSKTTDLTRSAVREAEARWVQDAYVQWALSLCSRALADEMVGGPS